MKVVWVAQPSTTEELATAVALSIFLKMYQKMFSTKLLRILEKGPNYVFVKEMAIFSILKKVQSNSHLPMNFLTLCDQNEVSKLIEKCTVLKQHEK